MKQYLFCIILFLQMALACMAGNQSSQVFHGTVSAITVNEKHYTNVPDQTFTLIRKSATSGVITGTLEKVGKMPGVLYFCFPVSIGSDGSLSVKSNIDVGELKLKVGLSKKLISKGFSGSVKANKLSFTLSVISKMLGIKIAEASFAFQ